MLIGLLAASVGVAVAELVGALVASAGSPVVAVGGYVVDNVPPQVKNLAIELFGTNDKTALIVGTLVVLALIGTVLGALVRGRPRVAAVVVLAVVVAGTLATLDQGDPPWILALFPSVVGAGAAVATLVVLGRLALPPASPAPAGTEGDRPRALDDMPSRRRFLLASASTVALAGSTAAVGRYLQTRNGAAADRAALVLPRPKRPLSPIPRSVAPDPAGVAPFTTPNRDFYRIDRNLLVPQVKTDGYELTVKGMVDRRLTIPWKDLIARDLSEHDITLTCVSNQVGDRLVGNARWLGFPLRELLDEAGVDRRADQVVGRSSDGYTGGFPVEAAYDREAIIAIGMNGEPLPLRHGFPVRLVTPGIYGYLSAVKWLTEIELTTFDAFDSYWVPRGYASRAPIRTMSRIDTPRSLSTLRAGKVMLGGMAWAQTRGIKRVEVRIDEGEWKPAVLSEALSKNTWRQWTLAWDATDAGLHTIAVRATDGDGETQPEKRRDPLPDGATGWHTIRVTVDS
jgi:DMSO/TMAO reductase YedYZ molybdopterin-dependent catalytic subunit